MSELTNELVPTTANEAAGVIEEFKSNNLALYSSFAGDSFEDRKNVVKAMTSSVPIADNLDKPIKVKDVVIHTVNVTDTETGEIVEQARTILIDDQGKAYHAISGVIINRLRDIIAVMGEPSTWDGPLTMKCSQVKGKGANRFYDLHII